MLAALPAATLLGARQSKQVNNAQEAVTGAVRSGVEFIKEKFNRSEESSVSAC